jgi:steroid delta-isomerase-like uncharacterized protein
VSAEENKRIVHRFLDEVISRGNLAALDEMCAPDFVWHGGSVGDFHNLEAFRQGIAPFFTAFPDLRVTPEETLADADKVVLRYSWHGTHRGDFFGIPASGKRVAVAGTSIYRVANGRIAEEWWLEDLLGLMQQLGAVPSPGRPRQVPSS